MALPAPENLRYDSKEDKLKWDSVEGADEYQIEYKASIAPSWSIAYNGGTATECPFDQSAGTYSLRGKTRKGGSWGIYGPEVEIYVT